ncbi:hypothetical protein [Kitasatospora sp. NPDC088351]|uniref:hypothetical protein n=1 Tax=Kitasatospora sp. NPDC088351 TaxID=3155180 RepID=UPI0034220307
MSGDQPYEGHDGIALLLLTLAGVIATPGLFVYGVRVLIRARRAGTRAAALAPAAVLTWAGVAGMYTWGLLHLFMSDDYGDSRACTAAAGTGRVVGYDPSFVPLEFGCRIDDGRTAGVIVPGYVNPVLAVLAVCAVALTVRAITRRQEGTRAAVPAPLP